VLYSFGGPVPEEWLASHPDHYAVSVKLPLRPAEWPRHPDGSVDIEAFPDRLYGPGHVIHYADGSAELVGIPEEQRWRDERILHRAACRLLRTLDDRYQVTAGPHDELGQLFAYDDKPMPCPSCSASPLPSLTAGP